MTDMEPGKYYRSNKTGHIAKCVGITRHGKAIIEYNHHDDGYLTQVTGILSDAHKHWKSVPSNEGEVHLEEMQSTDYYGRIDYD